jgi:CNT family concentrative nucleoside transporter
LNYQGILGLVVFMAFAWAISESRRQVRIRLLVVGLALQFLVALLLLRVPFFEHVFLLLNQAVLGLDRATATGTSFVFGFLGGGPLPFEEKTPGATFTLAFRALPLVLVISALTSLLYYWRLLPWVVRGFAWALQRTLHVGGALGLGAAANIFVGMVEAPLFVRPYLREMSRSDLFAVMTCGMATVAGTVMVLYAKVLGAVVPNAMGHILTASIISAPAAITVSRVMVPDSDGAAGGALLPPSQARSSMDAITIGTGDGVKLLVNIVAMLVVLVALVALVNLLLGLLPQLAGDPITLERLLGYLMAPVVWLMGVPWAEAQTAGALMGTKIVLNELLAYLNLARLPSEALSPGSRLIMTYAMCGFANFGSLGIMIGGLGAMVPERKGEIVALGMKSIVSGNLATCMTGIVVSFF